MDIPRQSIDNTRVDSTTQTNVSQVHQQPEPPVIGQSPRRVPPNVLAKMRYLEKPKSSSKGWRILKNIGFALAGAGLAFALASNPVGWGVAATIGVSAAMMAIGGLAAAGGTYKTIKADIYRADVKAYAASLDGPGPIKEESTNATRAGIIIGNLVEGLAYGVAGFFGAAGIGAAFKANFTMIGSQQASVATFNSAKTFLPLYWSTVPLFGGIGGIYYDHKRTQSQRSPRAEFEHHATTPLPQRTASHRSGMPDTAPMTNVYLKQTRLAQNKYNELGSVRVQGPVVQHNLDTHNNVPPSHDTLGQGLVGQHPTGKMDVRDNEVVWLLSRQDHDRAAQVAKSYRYESVPITGDLFAGGPPKLEDLRQSLKRANCYMSAAIASVLIRPGGWKKIEDIMHDNRNGTVTVRLKGADVTVDKTRIVTSAGDDVFNLGAPWVHILEKALSTYLMRDPDSGVNRVDYGQYKHVIDQLAHTLGGPDDPARDFTQVGTHLDRASDLKHEKWPPNWSGVIDRSLRDGHVVAFQTSDKNKSEQYLRRMIPDHVYPILGTAVRNGIEGYLVFDGYGTSVGWDGNSLGSFPNTTANDGQELTLDRGRRGSGPVFFVSKDEMNDLFYEVLHEPDNAPSLPQQNQVQQNQVENENPGRVEEEDESV